MDSPVVTELFRQLFRHRGCQLLRSHADLPCRKPSCPLSSSANLQRRTFTKKPATRRRKPDDGTYWRQRMDEFPKDISTELREYPLVTSGHLRSRRERPKQVNMLTRDFIEGTDEHVSALDITQF
jgi:hypothetical protein